MTTPEPEKCRLLTTFINVCKDVRLVPNVLSSTCLVTSDYGGIYLDHDVIVVKSFDAMRSHDFTMGRPVSYALNNGVMLGRQGAPFAQIWLETYRSPSLRLDYGYESVRTAHNLSQLFPHLVHVEERSLAQPNYLNVEAFYRDPYDWSDNYAIHVMGETVARTPSR